MVDIDAAEKRKKPINFPKLLVGDNVEVRSLDEGFMGSWHLGIVIEYKKGVRKVQFKNILSDDKIIYVHPVVDGITSVGKMRLFYRGLIRPIPPHLSFNRFSLHYGQCVDAYYGEAWWEGVIFDNENASDVRSVFFPDIGDLLRIRIDNLRITQEWNEYTLEWKPRRTWHFLELIKQFEQENLLHVSVRQIWYEMREKKGFQMIKEWTNSVTKRDVWGSLLREVIDDHSKLAAEKYNGEVAESVLSVDCENQLKKLGDVNNVNLNAICDPNKIHWDYLNAVCDKKEGHGDDLNVVCNKRETRGDDLNLVCNKKDIHGDDLNAVCDKKDIHGDDLNAVCDKKDIHGDDLNAVCDKKDIHGDDLNAVCNPNKIHWDYLNAVCDKKEGHGDDLNLVCNKKEIHGDYINAVCDKDIHGDELNLVCDQLPSNGKRKRKRKIVGTEVNTVKEIYGDDLNLVCEQLPTNRRKHRKRNWEIAGKHLVPGAEFCPGSVLEYLNSLSPSCKKNQPTSILALKLRKHLAYLGWKMEFCAEDGKPRMRYTSPDGKSYMSLATVCKDWDTSTIPDEVSGKLISSEGTCGDDDAGVEVNVVPLVTEEEEVHEDRFISKSNTKEECEKLSSSSGIHVEVLPSAQSMNHNTSLIPQDSNTISDDFFRLLFERPVETNNYHECQIAEHESVPDAGIFPDSIFKSKMKGPGESTLASISNSETTHEEISCSLPSIEPCNMAVSANEFPRQEDLNIVEKELPNSNNNKRKNPEMEIFSTIGEHQNEGTDGVPPCSCHSLDQLIGPKTCSSEDKDKEEFASVTLPDKRLFLSTLIDNGVVSPGVKVYYQGKKSGAPLKEGQVTREGIICNCCQNIFGLSKFEAHAGSTNHRPAANILLEDGRSLFQCQLQLKSRNNLTNMLASQPQKKSNHDNVKNIGTPPRQPQSKPNKIKKIVTQSTHPKRSQGLSTNDGVCSVCQLRGQLILCHQCPSSFHQECLGLKVIPDGEWFCLSCCCGICGRNKFNKGASQIMEGSVLNCHQCERIYHVGCLFKRGDTNMDRRHKGKWFCNKKCEQIFLGFRKLLGRPIVVGDDNLTWTLLKYTAHNELDGNDLDSVEILSNLNLAVSLIHECFGPLKEPRTNIDIAKDVIFSRGSNVKRLNFQGFYTVFLSRDDELISVATVRVKGENVAEVPLIGTRFQYRRKGMCRLLMNVLEKKLVELGVERLVVPLARNVLNFWTASFGFLKTTQSERLNFLSYTFLDFPGTATCHKILTKSAPSIRTQQNIYEGVGGSDNADINNKIKSSKIFQVEQTMDEIMCQRTKNAATCGVDGGKGTFPLILRV